MAKSKDDLNILSLIKQGVTEVIKEMDVVTRKDLDYLPSKDEFYVETLKVLKGIEDLKVEKNILSHQVSEHSDRIEKLEKIHPHSNRLQAT
jgi:hypothetical protein